jgi:hypothetical protein
MEAHEYTLADSVNRRATGLGLLLAAVEGFEDKPTASMLNALESHGVDVDNMEESAQEALDNYALETSVQRVFRMILAVGGPTQWLSAPIERETYGWTRCAPVTFHDSWAVPQETFLPDESPLVALIDRAIEFYEE